MVFTIFIRYKVVSAANAQGFGGIAGVAFLTTATSQGMQYVAILFSNRGIGNVNMNVIFSLSFVTFITAMAVLGMGWIKDLFSYLGIFCAVILFLIGLASDIRSFFPPRKGIGIFLGLFNPFSKAHLKMLEQALQKRGLEKIFIHVTPILPVQANALKKGEIKIKTQSDEFTTYEKTEKADVHVDYFPTGNEFIKYEMRLFSIKEAIEGTEVENKIEIISYPEIFGKKGFHGVVAEIKRLNPLQVIHGLHGNDFDGMSVRRIYDESGWIFPYYAKVAR